MSKNIVIQEGGIGKQLTVDKLKTNLVGGGTCLWVPEDGTQLGTKYISENGTYRASDDGYYGYSEVTVNGIGTVSGKDPDTGDDVVVTKDPDTGEIVKTVVPSEIRVTTLPTKTTYANGETIDYTGIVVHGYSGTGQDLGEIPFSELVFPVTTADSGQVEGQTATSDLTTQPASPIKCGGGIGFVLKATWGVGPITRTEAYSGGTCVVVQGTDEPGNYKLIIASSSNGQYSFSSETTLDETGEVIAHNSYTGALDRSYKYNGKTAYYHYEEYITGARLTQPSPEHLNSQASVTHGAVAWTIIYGTISGGEQVIPVQWSYTGGSAILETSFGISVT